MAKIIRTEKINETSKTANDAIKEIVARTYGVKTICVTLNVWRYSWGDNTVKFGYWVPGYSYPVAYQDEKGRIAVVKPEEYYEHYEILINDEGA